jgi:hypothetical protein
LDGSVKAIASKGENMYIKAIYGFSGTKLLLPGPRGATLSQGISTATWKLQTDPRPGKGRARRHCQPQLKNYKLNKSSQNTLVLSREIFVYSAS